MRIKKLDKEEVKAAYAKTPCCRSVGEMFGVSRQRIHQIITGYGRKKKDDWWFLRADWSKSNKEIAQEFNKHVTTVHIARRRLGQTRVKWWQSPEIDWSQTDSAIAHQVNKTSAAVGYIRRKYIKKGNANEQ